MNDLNSVLSLEDVCISYGPKPVVTDISFVVPKGECFGLIGLNGAGKTTLIKSILGLRDQDAGKIEIFGQPPSKKESKKLLAYLPEKFEPPWFLKGGEFIRFSLDLYRHAFNEKEIEQLAVDFALDPEVLSRKVQTYSKGMRQKLGLIATLATGCPFLILDEPMSGLDPLARALTKEAVLRAKKEGRTVFFSSHILSDVKEICDQIAVIHGGTIVFSGRPADLCSSMKTESLEKAFLDLIQQGAPLRKAV